MVRGQIPQMHRLLCQSLASRSFLSAVGASYLLMGAAIVTQLLLVPFYLTHLGTVQFGMLMMLLSAVNFAVIGIAWMSGGSLRLLGEFAGLGRLDDFRRAFGLIKSVYVGYGVLAAIVFALCAAFLAHLIWREAGADDLAAARWGLIVTGLYLVVFYAASVDRLALTAQKRQGLANLAQAGGIVVAALGSVAALVAGHGMAGVMAAQILGAACSFVATRLVLARDMPGLAMRWPMEAADRDLRQRLGGRTGLGFFLHGALVLALAADTALIGLVGGPVAAANFYLVWKIGEVIVQLISKLTEPLAPYFVHMDARGEHDRLHHIARTGYAAVVAIALVAGIAYGVSGRDIVALWVGDAKAPEGALAYWLAGGAIVWLAIARLPAVVAGAKVTLKPLNIAGLFEFFGKWLVTLVLFPRLGYVALLIGINIVHLCGAAWLYFRLLRVEGEANQDARANAPAEGMMP